MASIRTSTEAHWNHGSPPSVVDLVAASCAVHAESVAFSQMGRSITYGDLDHLSRNFAAYLQKSLGLRKGERLALVLPNILQFPVAMLGALRAGLVVVNTNPMYTAPELERQLRDSGASAVIVLDNLLHTIVEVRGRTSVRHVVSTAVGDFLTFPKSYLVNFVSRRRMRHRRADTRETTGFMESLSVGARLPFERVRIAPDDLAYLQYTGGTAGDPKGAMLTHGNICANLLQCEAWLNGSFAKPDTLITALPLYHIFALTIGCLLFLRLGWANRLVLDARDTGRLIAVMRRYPFAFFSGVNTLFKALMNHPDFGRINFRHLRLALAGGMAVDRGVAEQWKALTGTDLTQAWGLTETSPGACVNPRNTEYNGSVGMPIPGTEIAAKDDAGIDLATGTIGEICVRGPQVMAGYWNLPDETAKVMLPGGWLRTGDIGHMDEHGYVYIEDRKKDLILVSGFNVYPNEVESVLVTHPGVLEVAAVAQADERSGEAVAVFVVRKDSKLTQHEVIEHAKKSLAGYKVPKQVYFKAELPKTNLGKIAKQTLRNELALTTANLCR